MTNRWIYSSQLTPIAEVDSAANIIAAYHGSYMKKGDTSYSIIRDYLGSVRFILNSATGEIAQRIDYDEFGNVTFDSNPGFQPFGFAGGLYDNQTKLTRFGVRDYNASVGRWTMNDPIRFAGKDPNFYCYVGNNPIIYVDPQGEITFSVGVSGDIQVGPVDINFNAGFAIDDNGNVGVYYGGGLGMGAGAHASGGLSFMGSTAQNICDLAGPFGNLTIGGGAGLDIAGSGFGGNSPDGRVFGGGVIIGAGLGGGSSTTYTQTVVTPLGKLW